MTPILVDCIGEIHRGGPVSHPQRSCRAANALLPVSSICMLAWDRPSGGLAKSGQSPIPREPLPCQGRGRQRTGVHFTRRALPAGSRTTNVAADRVMAHDMHELD